MSTARVVAVAPGSAGERAGVRAGDHLVRIDGRTPRDVIEFHTLMDTGEVTLEVERGGLVLDLDVQRGFGEAVGIELESALFDQVQTCDNHCEFCFIYQLPPGMRRSLYLKDDDYRLSFLYGNFTTLTRFTEADLERVLDSGLSPLHVSIHATDPEIRADLLRNRRGATSLRWLRALLDHGVEVHGQVVVCPGVNDASVLDDTLLGVLERYDDLSSLCVVPLGVSRFNTEARMRPHTVAEAVEVLEIIHAWQQRFLDSLGRRLVHAADEYYLLAGWPFPDPVTYEGFPMHENGVGIARTFEAEFRGTVDAARGPESGFFHWVDGAPAEGYRAPRSASQAGPTLRIGPRRSAPVGVLTGVYGATVLGPLLAELDRDDIRVIVVDNDFFGGNIGVAGLMVGADVARVLELEPAGHRYLLPDVCLSNGRFLDGVTPDELPRPVEVIPTDGLALRAALEPTGGRRAETTSQAGVT